jgi:hypothetical protein
MYVFFAKSSILTLTNSCVVKLEQARRAAHSPLGVAILSQPEIKTMRGRFSSTMGRLTHRLRSLSPQKRTPGMEGARKG